MPSKNGGKPTKVEALIEEGTLNPLPQKVSDPKFRDNEFFDPRDAVQVKYEMLRRVLVENVSITDAAEQYGISRPTYYQAKANFNGAGIAGLVPKKRGPHGPHKIRGDVLAFIETQIVPGEPIRAREIAKRVGEQFGLHVHPRTIERAVGVKKTAT
jgi:transposase